MIVFSFCLYGNLPKYTHGMLANAKHIPVRFPGAIVQIYVASDVPVDIREQLLALPNVRIIDTERRPGIGGMFDRLTAIDASDCDIMFVRDADSRVHERDAACIEDFIAATDKKFHICRDHYHHRYRVMGGLFGIRQHALPQPMTSLINEWKKARSTEYYVADQEFLSACIYPLLVKDALIHDRYGYFRATETLTPFRMPIVNDLFMGQVHLFDVNGNEYVEFRA